MTSLSKELCKLCGIKPRYKCKNVPCLNFMFNTGICNITESICNPYECNDNYEPDTTHRSWREGQAFYPDFEKPENFVKLLEIIHDRMSIEGLLMCETNEDSITRRFLKLVIKFLSGELGYVETKIDAVKQAIRDEEWVYG